MKARIAALGLLAGACGGGGETDDPSGSNGVESAGTPWFRDVAAESGVDFEHVRALDQRYWFPEIIGSGLAFFDYDGDGDVDLYVVQSGELAPAGRDLPGNRLFANDGGQFTDVTGTAGVGDTGYGMGCATGDYDGDGDVDLYVTNTGPNVLYRNEGDGTFTDVSDAAGVDHEGWGLSAAFVDYDADGDLDLFFVNYVNWKSGNEVGCRSQFGELDYCHPNNYDAPAADTLYRNDGDGTFTDVSTSSGVAATFGNGMGLACADFDGDGAVDLFVANDGMPNQLWMNRGGGKFEDRALLAGCAVNVQGAAEASMGVAPVDVDEDGDIDLFMTHLVGESNTFYKNRRGIFSDQTTATGLGAPSMAYTGFGVGFADFDHDGVQDLYIANGRVGDTRPHAREDDIYAESNLLFRGLGSGRFEEVLPQGGTAQPWIGNSRGVAFADYDADGDVDLAVVDNAGRLRLLRNEAPKSGHWAVLSVLDADGKTAIGAQVRIVAGGGERWRSVRTAYSYCSASDPRVHVGLGASERIETVEVTWTDGAQTSFGPLEADLVHELRRK
ncbi:MAG: CRTAC1 family protein [bacterium]|nr:CRTAC1 family protein [bacterium]